MSKFYEDNKDIVVASMEALFHRLTEEADSILQVPMMMYAEQCAYFDFLELRDWYLVTLYAEAKPVAGGYCIIGEAYATEEDYMEGNNADIKIESKMVDGKYTVKYTPLWKL